MKKVLTICFAIFTSSLMAADLFVQEFGGGGTYPNINDAMTAANAGDRIFIVPKAGDAPYIENLTISKSLQLLTSANGRLFKLQGNVTIGTSLAAGSSVMIDGMWISNGDIKGANSTNAIKFSLVNSQMDRGIINLGQNINVTLANNTIKNTLTSGYAVTITKGKLLGNIIEGLSYGVEIASDATASLDTNLIVGNQITVKEYSVGGKGIYWNNNTQFFYISNNYIFFSNTQGASAVEYYLIHIEAFKAGSNSREFNNIINNSLRTAVTISGFTSRYYGVRATTLDSRVNILNNIFMFDNLGTDGTRVFSQTGGNPQISYNVLRGGTLFSPGSHDATNIAENSPTVVYTMNTNGCLTAPINAGHPDPIFTDLDLTRNDIGACGGSYNIEVNFRNQGTAGSAKVHWLEAPKRVIQGGTIQIKGEGHDR